ncbi:MAG: cytochrome c1, partial [Gammaproteobacteria bacterium]
MRASLAALLLVPLFAFAAGTDIRLDRANIDRTDALSIQRGVQVFVNYCLNCHSAAYMRYDRLTELGL